jgi:hypothetical protein
VARLVQCGLELLDDLVVPGGSKLSPHPVPRSPAST